MKTTPTASANRSVHPLVYEINTRCWLNELAASAGRPIDLARIPQREFEKWRRLGFTHLWLMGVWKVGPRARAHSLRHRTSISQEQPVSTRTILGSPYAIADYSTAPSLGANAALREFRAQLNSHGLKLLLDFIPNHVGLDHRWLKERPELFVRGSARARGTFLQRTKHGLKWIAHGRDPFFAPWTDTAQLDYRNPETHAAMLKELDRVAEFCDGVRCDMAMLVLQDVFRKTWAQFKAPPEQSEMEFWANAIPAVKKTRPEFLFLAECYWGLESRLQSLGFDYTYDKIFYDHLLARNIDQLQGHLQGASTRFLASSAHFLENHDEPRIASILNPEEHRSAALLLLGLPGLRLLHEGQLTGAQKRASVHLGCRPVETPNAEIAAMYTELLQCVCESGVGVGKATILRPQPAGEGNPTAKNFFLIQWHSGGEDFHLVVLNMANHRSQCYAPLLLPKTRTRKWTLRNRLGAENCLAETHELGGKGLFLDLLAHTGQLLHGTPA